MAELPRRCRRRFWSSSRSRQRPPSWPLPRPSTAELSRRTQSHLESPIAPSGSRRHLGLKVRPGSWGGTQPVSRWLVTSIPSWVLLIGLIVVIVGGAVLIQQFVRRRYPALTGDDHNDVLKFTYGFIGFVYAFFIGFVVSSMWGQINTADANAHAEGAAAVQMARDAIVFDVADSDRVRQALLSYAQAAVPSGPRPERPIRRRPTAPWRRSTPLTSRSSRSPTSRRRPWRRRCPTSTRSVRPERCGSSQLAMTPGPHGHCGRSSS